MNTYPGNMLISKSKFIENTLEYKKLQDNYVRVTFHYCAICGSDISTFFEKRLNLYPISMGHEFVGIISEVGKDVEEFAVNDVVTSDLNYRCNECEFCLNGKSHLCVKGQEGFFSNRAFALSSDLHENYLTKIPDYPPKPFMTLIEPLSCMIHAFKGIKPNKSDKILIVGAGGLGICLIFLLACYEFETFDVLEQSKERLDKISKCIPDKARCLTTVSSKYDVVFDVSGTDEGLKISCKHTISGGRLSSMSHLYGAKSAHFLYTDLLRKDIIFNQSYLNGEKENIIIAIDLLCKNWSINWDILLSVQPITKLQKIFENRPNSPYNKDIIDLTIWH